MASVNLGEVRQLIDRLEHTRLAPRDDDEIVALAAVVQSARNALVALCEEAEVSRALAEAVEAIGSRRR